jgi:protein-S-isoprenylcysteine O-methyltransferase Ste14
VTDPAATASPSPAGGRERHRGLGIARLAAVYLAVAVLAWLSRPTPGLVALGGLFVLAGEVTRAWAAGHLLKSRELVTSGPYRYTQNPLYLGRLLILTGFCVMARLPWFANLLVLALGWTVFFFYYLPRKIRVEGGRLKRLHGQAWEEYFSSVPLLFPRLTPHGENQRRWDPARFLRNREHWMIAGVTGVTLFFLYRALQP